MEAELLFLGEAVDVIRLSLSLVTWGSTSLFDPAAQSGGVPSVSLSFAC